ncbi:MAG TPA: hypothetical protein V6D29_11855 [Leptolyngbyaceae cyanobacterium]
MTFFSWYLGLVPRKLGWSSGSMATSDLGASIKPYAADYMTTVDAKGQYAYALSLSRSSGRLTRRTRIL